MRLYRLLPDNRRHCEASTARRGPALPTALRTCQSAIGLSSDVSARTQQRPERALTQSPESWIANVRFGAIWNSRTMSAKGAMQPVRCADHERPLRSELEPAANDRQGRPAAKAVSRWLARAPEALASRYRRRQCLLTRRARPRGPRPDSARCFLLRSECVPRPLPLSAKWPLGTGAGEKVAGLVTKGKR